MIMGRAGRGAAGSLLVILVTLIAAGVGLARGWGGPPAEPGGGPGGPGMGPGMEMLRERGGPGEAMPMELGRLHRLLAMLELTGEQRAEIGQIVEATRESIMELRSDHAEDALSPLAFAEVFSREDLDVDDLEELMDQGAELREEMLEIVLEAIVEVHDVLTPEQLDRILALAELAEAAGMGTHWGGPGGH